MLSSQQEYLAAYLKNLSPEIIHPRPSTEEMHLKSLAFVRVTSGLYFNDEFTTLFARLRAAIFVNQFRQPIHMILCDDQPRSTIQLSYYPEKEEWILFIPSEHAYHSFNKINSLVDKILQNFTGDLTALSIDFYCVADQLLMNDLTNNQNIILINNILDHWQNQLARKRTYNQFFYNVNIDELKATTVKQIPIKEEVATAKTRKQYLWLYVAVKSSDNESIKKLLTLELDFEPASLFELIEIAAETNNAIAMEYLCKKINHSNINFIQNKCSTIFWDACREGQDEIVKHLLASGVQPDNSLMEPSPLFAASLFGHNEIVKMLLKAGANPEYTYNGFTPFLLAFCDKNFSLIKILLPYLPVNYLIDLSNETIFSTIFQKHPGIESVFAQQNKRNFFIGEFLYHAKLYYEFAELMPTRYGHLHSSIMQWIHEGSKTHSHNGGHCCGTSDTANLFHLAGKFDYYAQLIKLLRKIGPAQLCKTATEVRNKRINKEPLTKDDELLEDALSILELSEIFQAAYQYPELFPDSNKQTGQNFTSTTKTYTLKSITEQGEVVVIDRFFGMYSLQELSLYLEIFSRQFNFDNAGELKYAISLNNVGHAISIHYHPDTKKWVLMNDTIYEINDTGLLARYIFNSFYLPPNSTNIIFQTAIYSTKMYEDKMNFIINNLKEDKNFKLIHEIGNSKINQIDGENNSFLSLAIWTKNIEKVKILLNEGADPNLLITGKNRKVTTPFLLAILANEINAIRAILDKDVDLNFEINITDHPVFKNVQLPSPLEYAREINDPDILILLLGKIKEKVKTALIKKEAKDKETKIFKDMSYKYFKWAIEKGHPQIVNFFLDLGIDPNFSLDISFYYVSYFKKIEFDVKPLYLALKKYSDIEEGLRNKYFPIIESLINKGSALDFDPNHFKNIFKVIELLLNKFETKFKDAFSKNASKKRHDNEFKNIGTSLFIYSAKNGHDQFVKTFLDLGIHPDVIPSKGENTTALFLAINECQHDNENNVYYKIIKLLLEKEATPTVTGDHALDQSFKGITPLHIAAKRGLPKLVELLLQSQADPNYPNKTDMTPLHDAVMIRNNKNKRAAIIDLLSLYGANIDALNNTHSTPLHQATMKNDINAVNILLSKGADPNIINNSGRTALNIAIASSYYEIVKLLLSYNASPKQVNGQTIPPFVHALYKGDADTIRLLLEKDRELINTTFSVSAENLRKQTDSIFKKGNQKIIMTQNREKLINNNSGTNVTLDANTIVKIMGHKNLLSVLSQYSCNQNSLPRKRM